MRIQRGECLENCALSGLVFPDQARNLIHFKRSRILHRSEVGNANFDKYHLDGPASMRS